MDDPVDIVNGALEQHTKMIKQMKGVPGNFVIFNSFNKYYELLSSQWLLCLDSFIELKSCISNIIQKLSVLSLG